MSSKLYTVVTPFKAFGREYKRTAEGESASFEELPEDDREKLLEPYIAGGNVTVFTKPEPARKTPAKVDKV